VALLYTAPADLSIAFLKFFEKFLPDITKLSERGYFAGNLGKLSHGGKIQLDFPEVFMYNRRIGKELLLWILDLKQTSSPS
jgi:hypothetical protein